jgi:hypothetical protein
VISFRWFLLAGSLAVASTACHDSCGKGYVLKEHLCVPEAAHEDVKDAGHDELDASSSDAGNTVLPTCTDSTFNATCLLATDCGCDTGYCAGYPGQPGICTHTGCLEGQAVCPATWGCMDLSALVQPGLSICTPP